MKVEVSIWLAKGREPLKQKGRSVLADRPSIAARHARAALELYRHDLWKLFYVEEDQWDDKPAIVAKYGCAEYQEVFVVFLLSYEIRPSDLAIRRAIDRINAVLMT